MVMLGQSVDLTTLSMGKLRPSKGLNSNKYKILLPITDNCPSQSNAGPLALESMCCHGRLLVDIKGAPIPVLKTTSFRQKSILSPIPISQNYAFRSVSSSLCSFHMCLRKLELHID